MRVFFDQVHDGLLVIQRGVVLGAVDKRQLASSSAYAWPWGVSRRRLLVSRVRDFYYLKGWIDLRSIGGKSLL
jgi:hypothetical protein